MEKNEIIVSDCFFEIDPHSKSSLYYVNGKEGSIIKVKNCNFNGFSDKLMKYIDGKDENQDSNRLLIESCNFQYETKKIKVNNTWMINSFFTVFAITIAFFILKISISIYYELLVSKQHEDELMI